jgi:hypothetical protein
MSSLVSQLCSRVARGDPLEILVLDDLCNTFWQNTYLRHFSLTWIQNGPLGFEKKNTTRKKTYVPNDDYDVSVGLH